MQDSPNSSQILLADIEDEMRTAYIDYAMSVIISRALPDARDGLKPVHRRVLYAMSQDLGLTYNKAYKKSARIVGECFVAGTLVSTPKGLIPIEKLAIGDEVFTQNATRKVTELYEMPEQDLLEVKLKDGSKNICTKGQMFKVMNEFFEAVWKEAQYLKIGDKVITIPQTVVNSDKGACSLANTEYTSLVQKAEYIEIAEINLAKPDKTYDIQVETDHEFIANGMLVHNCLGKYHPHGDTSVYDTMVRMAQPWSLRYPLVDGQGNFGSMDGDSPAAMRYCVTAETLVKTNQGILPIAKIEKDLAENSEKDINVKVLSLHKNTNKASKLFNSGIHPTYKLQTKEGFSLEGTNNHPVLVIEKDEEGKPQYHWKLLEEVEAGDKVVIDRTAQSLNEKPASIQEKQLAKTLAQKDLTEIPEEVFAFTKEGQKIFLQNFLSPLDVSAQPNISLELSSEKLAKDLQILLLEFGVIAKITRNNILIEDYTNLKKFYQNIGFASVEAHHSKNENLFQASTLETKTYLAYIQAYLQKYTNWNQRKVENQDLQKIVSALNSEILQATFKQFVSDRYYFATVASCEKQAEEKTVYSLKVESNCHSFVANGFINHNTEARLQRISDELLEDIKKETVDFQPNFDDSLKEPTVLPNKFPQLLVNGTSGIAVGMATNMAPHNLSEVINGINAYLDNNEIEIEELMQHIPAPDFPTGGIIYGYNGVQKAFRTGRGRVVLRAKADFHTTKAGKEQIIVSEIPYLVNKANMIKKTAALVNDKKIEGISDIRDESDRKGLRVVYDLKRDAMPAVVLNQLYKFTDLQNSFSINNVALVKGRPYTLNIKELIYYFVEHRYEVIVRRTEYELKEAKARQHILEGILIALDNLDEVIALIRASKNAEDAKNGLMTTFELSEIQAKAILDIRLQRLTAMEREKVVEEHRKITELIAHLEAILANKSMQTDIIKEELAAIKDRFGDERRSEIMHDVDEMLDEDLIPEETMLVTISHQGYIKRNALDEYRTQGRGGVGSRGVSKDSEDFTEHLFVASTHDYLLVFTNTGKVFWIKTFQIPEAGKTAKGRAIQNFLQIEKEERIQAIINVSNLNDPDYVQNHFLVMCTENGTIKKTSLEQFSRPRQNGIIAISIHEGDSLLDVKLTDGDNDIILAVRSGRAIRFHEEKVRAMGRTAAGVRGITLDDNEDKLVGMVCIRRDAATLLVVSENGYGKRSDIEDYRMTNRGGKGVTTLKITEKTGKLVAIKSVVESDDLMIINRSGMIIRMAVADMRVMGRATQGVRLIRLNDGDNIASVARVESSPLTPEGESPLVPKGETENQVSTEDVDTNNLSENGSEEA